MIEFPISGIETYWWLPVLVAFLVSLLTSTAGVSGAFLLLPFQVSVLGFTGPAVSPTNLIYNIVAIPSGVWRYHREGRILWPLGLVMIIGTLPGVFIGAVVRLSYLPDPRTFKLFAGAVLLYVGVRLALSLFGKTPTGSGVAAGADFAVAGGALDLRRLSYKFTGRKYTASTPGLFALSVIVGVIGGAYGIGGGAIIAPFLVAVFGLPVYTIAGAALLGTLVTSVVGVLFYLLISPLYADTGLAIMPDWLLGAMFGVGGAIGMYAGARLQKYLPAGVIKVVLILCLGFVAVKYIAGFFLDA
jgi:hypothetical protein